MEAKDPKATETSAGVDQNPSSRGPDSEATSDETLSDLEREEQTTTTGSESDGETGSSSAGQDAPSPDGAFDGTRGGRDVGPM